MSQFFDDAYKKLNSQQREAVDAIEGPVMVVAGPGTGKTQILTLRIANILLKTQNNPENILALTFTESASMEMRQRLSEIIGTQAFRVEICTFHGFANSIIKNHPEVFPELLSADSITEVEQIEVLEGLIESLDLKLLRPFGEPLHYLRDCLSGINDLKKEGVIPEQLKVAIEKEKEDFDKIEDLYHDKGRYIGAMKGKYQDLQKQILKQEEFLQIFEGYQKTLVEQKKYDFNDMLLMVVKVLEQNQGLLLLIQEKYQYVLVDEHQDTNASQNRLVELIMSFYDIPNLFVVGDEKQAIYRFQGASLENFSFFKKLYPTAKLINLEQNYRSHQGILDAATSLISNNVSANILSSDQHLQAQLGKTVQKIRVAALSDQFCENFFIATDIAKKIDEGLTPNEIAILARRNADLVEIASALDRVGVDSVMEADQNIFADLSVQKLIILFWAVANFGDDQFLIRAMHIDFLGIEPLDIYKLLQISKKDHLSMFQIISKLNDKKIEEYDLESGEKIKDFYQRLKKWKVDSENISFDDVFVEILNESGLRDSFLKKPERYQSLQKISALFEDIKQKVYKSPEYSLMDFLNYLETLKKHQVILKSGVSLSQQEGVRLLTVHKSKGLEFDYVYIIGCSEGHWGNSRKRGAKIKLPWDYLGEQRKMEVEFEEIEDERRLFFVALTRARQVITLTYSRTGTDGREQLPSQFLSEINPDLIEEISVDEFENEFSSNRAVVFERKIPIVDPKDKQYFNKLFLEKGLSITGFENYLECPWKYFYRNLISLPDVKNKFLIFGTSIHFALDSFIKNRKEKILGVDYLYNKFEESLAAYALSERDLAELKVKGRVALEGYFKNIIPGWRENILSEMVVRGVKLSDQLMLNGRLDMIEPLDEGYVRVHDFKTGKPKSRGQIDGTSEKSGYNYLRQLTFYKLLLDKYKGGSMKMREGVIDFVEPDEKGRFKSEVFEIEIQALNALENQLLSVSEEIYELKFWDQFCVKKDCEYCELRRITFGNRGE